MDGDEPSATGPGRRLKHGAQICRGPPFKRSGARRSKLTGVRTPLQHELIRASAVANSRSLPWCDAYPVAVVTSQRGRRIRAISQIVLVAGMRRPRHWDDRSANNCGFRPYPASCHVYAYSAARTFRPAGTCLRRRERSRRVIAGLCVFEIVLHQADFLCRLGRCGCRRQCPVGPEHHPACQRYARSVTLTLPKAVLNGCEHP